MTQITLEEAEREFAASVAYYEAREPGLGLRFRHQVEAVVHWICRFPEVPRLRKQRYRRVNLRTFPHYVADRPTGFRTTLTGMPCATPPNRLCSQA